MSETKNDKDTFLLAVIGISVFIAVIFSIIL